MSLAATAATQNPARRRGRISAEAVVTVDSRHRRSAARRKGQEPAENPAMHYGLPDGFVSTGIVVTMLGIVAIHHRTLLDAVFSLLL